MPRYDKFQFPICSAAIVLGLMAATSAVHEVNAAPYAAPAEGTVLEITGVGKCTALRAEGLHWSCRTRAGKEIERFGAIQFIGKVPTSPYLRERWKTKCGRHNVIAWKIGLGDDARLAIASLWPLKAGARISYRLDVDWDARKAPRQAAVTARIVGPEEIVVGGRTIAAIRIDSNIDFGECGGQTLGRQKVSVWYDGASGSVVREIFAWINGGGKARSGSADYILPAGAGAKIAAATLVNPAAPKQTEVVVKTDDAGPTIDLPARVSTESAVVEIAGYIRDDSAVVEVTLNGRAIPMSDDGAISIRRGVPVGTSKLTVAALDEWGNQSNLEIDVERAVVAAAATTRSSGKVSTVVTPRTEITVSEGDDRTDSPFADINFGRYHALVIGNNDYPDLPNLKSAVNDAKSVAAALTEDYGFEVDLLLNGTRAQIIGALAKFRAKLKRNDNLLVYYAGHGILDTYAKEGYWLPVDAAKDNPANWVSNSDITNMVRALRAKHVMVVADSCYSGTLVRAADAKIKTAEEREVWIKRMASKRTRTALVSGGLEPVIDGGGGNHSVFAKAFLDALEANTSVLEGQSLYTAIKRPVALESDQTPQYSDIRRSGHDGGDFLFVKR